MNISFCARKDKNGRGKEIKKETLIFATKLSAKCKMSENLALFTKYVVSEKIKKNFEKTHEPIII